MQLFVYEITDPEQCPSIYHVNPRRHLFLRKNYSTLISILSWWRTSQIVPVEEMKLNNIFKSQSSQQLQDKYLLDSVAGRDTRDRRSEKPVYVLRKFIHKSWEVEQENYSETGKQLHLHYRRFHRVFLRLIRTCLVNRNLVSLNIQQQQKKRYLISFTFQYYFSF